MEKRIILASQSPRRKQLLQGLGLSFIVISSSVDEDDVVSKLSPETPVELVRVLSESKAKAVAEMLSEGLVIGADTIVVLDQEVLGKPKSSQDARQMLQRLSGRTHAVISGVTIVDANTHEARTIHTVTEVDFRPVTEQELDRYLDKADYMDKAGAYAIQEHGALFVTGIRGCFFNVVGLPISHTADLLLEFGVDIL